MGNRVNNNEVFIEETFNASVEKVFSAWTDPEKLMKWYAPDGCTIYFKKIEIKTGDNSTRVFLILNSETVGA